MIVGKTKSDVDKLWEAFWTNGITNPISVIEQINYLLFIRKLDELDKRAERIEARTKKPTRRIFDKKQQHLRWSHFKELPSAEMIKVVQTEVFPFIKTLGDSSKDPEINTFSKTLSDAVFLIQKPSLLSSAVALISGLDLDNADTAGDLYEYLLSRLSTSGINGQFRTARHIIKMMVEIIDPEIGERICDPACGTAGFLQSALTYLMEKHTSPKVIQTDSDGVKYGFVGDLMSKDQRVKFDQDTFFGFDFDSTMLRVASMNMWLHGIESPNMVQADTLSKSFVEENRYEVILANPPFKGKFDSADCSPTLSSEVSTKKTELLFLLLSIRILDIGGRAAVIVPDGVLFGSSNAHVAVRKLLIEDNQLEGVINMPGGVFKPYSGVSTAVLLFTKGGATDKVWFYDMEHDGFSLDDKREPTSENDIPDVINCWKNRSNRKFLSERSNRVSALGSEMEPIKGKAKKLETEIDELRFTEALDPSSSGAIQLRKLRATLKSLSEKLHVLQNEYNQLGRQFWVDKKTLVSNRYELSASRYRAFAHDDDYYPAPKVSLKRLKQLDSALSVTLRELEALVK